VLKSGEVLRRAIDAGQACKDGCQEFPWFASDDSGDIFFFSTEEKRDQYLKAVVHDLQEDMAWDGQPVFAGRLTHYYEDGERQEC